MSRILTCGLSYIDSDKFNSSGSCILNKPKSWALYGSTMIKNGNKIWSSWLDFVLESPDWFDKYSKGISFTLHKSSKIYEVCDLDSYLELLNKYHTIEHSYNDVYKASIDWVNFSKDYDAFHLTLDAFYDLRMFFGNLIINNLKVIVDNFYSYDCETWIIFNIDSINKGSILNHSIKLENNYDN